MTKTRRVICALNIQEPGAYTETKFLKWLNGLDWKEHCASWDIYKKMDPHWKEKPCPSDPKDLAGWMKHYSAKYTSPAQCTRRSKQLAIAQKRVAKTAQKVEACHKKQWGKLTEQLNTTFEQKIEPCQTLKEYSLSSKRYYKSPKIKCIDKVRKSPEIKRLVKQREVCQTQKCKKINDLVKLHVKQVVKAAEQRY